MRIYTKNYINFEIKDDTGIMVQENVQCNETERVLYGDRVGNQAGKWLLVERAKVPPLVGILQLNGKYKFGFSSRGIPIYLFKPYDAAYPPMRVGCSERDITQNLIVQVEFAAWDVGEKLPRANLTRTFGPVGFKDAEVQGLFQHYSPWTQYTKKQLQELLGAVQFDNLPIDAERIDLTTVPTINIDPASTQDIDDLIGAEVDTQKPDCWWIYITIADVASVIPIGSAIDIHAATVGNTIYHDGYEPRHMIPTVMSTEVVSLIPGQRRRGVTLMSRFNIAKGIVEKTLFKMSWVKNNERHTYDSVYKNTIIPVSILKGYAAAVTPQNIETNDSHEWVAAFMMDYNKMAANYIAKYNSGILRSLEKKESDEFTHIPELQFLAELAATYTDASILPIQLHYKMGGMYCHATSPIRRYADIVNQRVIIAVCTGTKIPIYPLGEIVARLNERQRETKLHDRYAGFVDIIASENNRGFVSGNVVRIKRKENGSYRIYIWIPAWKRIVKKTLEEVIPPPVGINVNMEYLVQPHLMGWKDRVLFRFL